MKARSWNGSRRDVGLQSQTALFELREPVMHDGGRSAFGDRVDKPPDLAADLLKFGLLRLLLAGHFGLQPVPLGRETFGENSEHGWVHQAGAQGVQRFPF